MLTFSHTASVLWLKYIHMSSLIVRLKVVFTFILRLAKGPIVFMS